MMNVEYSDANMDMMLSAPRQAVLLAGGAAFRSTDGMETRTLADIRANHRSLYDLCSCGVPKKVTARRCKTCCDRDRDPVARFWSKVDRTATCWVWTATVSTRGYGRFHLDGRAHQAHRIAFELVRGPIPAGMELDHLCRVRRCVRPDHLEPVTTAENLRRGYGQSGINARKSFCKKGHPLDGVNPGGLQAGTRFCRTCKAAVQADWWARNGDRVNAERRAARLALTRLAEALEAMR